MSGFWNQDDNGDDFRDNPVELNEGQWQSNASNQAPASAPRPKAPTKPKQEEAYPTPEHLADSFVEEDDEEDFTAVLSDARLRLEQGKLYEIIMNHELFDGTDSDPRAVRNVQREIKRFAKERMEIMLGMRQEKAVAAIVSSPFNSLEVDVLKSLAARATNGATKTVSVEPQKVIEPPKKTTLNTIASPQPKATPKPNFSNKTAPVARPKSNRLKNTPPEVEQASKEDVEAEYVPLGKPAHELDQDQLAERARETAERQAGKKAKMPTDRLPMATYDQQEYLAQQQAMNSGNSPGVGRLVELINLSNSRKN